MSNKTTNQETTLLLAEINGTEIMRISISPYNDATTNRKIAFDVFKQWVGATNIWRDGSGVPSNGLGANGDYYLDDSTGLVYNKSAGTYSAVANIKGADGANGANGTNGTNGTNGVGVPTGGTINQALVKVDGTDYNTTWTTINKTFVGLSNVDNTSDVNKPVSTAQAAADAAILASANSYTDSSVVGLWDDRGSFSAAGGAYPTTGGSGTAGAILKGDTWTISVAGTLPTGQVVNIGDVIRALIDTPGNTQANWAIVENNIGYVPENIANKNATGGYAGLSVFRLLLKNVLGTVSSLLENAATTARTWVLPDKDGTIAMTSDIPLNNMIATVDPTATDDDSLGYVIGSLWFVQPTGLLWVCEDATTTAAVWQSVFDESGARTIRGVNATGDVNVYAPGRGVNLGDDGSGNRTKIKIQDNRKKIVLAGTLQTNLIVVNDADATIVSGDFGVVVENITATRTVNLPPIDADGKLIFVKATSTTSGINQYAIVLPDGTDTIDMGSHYPFVRASMGVLLSSNLASTNWEIIALVPGGYNFLDAQIEFIASKSVTGNSLATTALDWFPGMSYADHIPLFYVIQYGSGTLGIGVAKVKNSVNDLTNTFALLNVTTTQEMSTNNKDAVIHPNSGDISVEVTTASLAASSFTVSAFGKRR